MHAPHAYIHTFLTVRTNINNEMYQFNDPFRGRVMNKDSKDRSRLYASFGMVNVIGSADRVAKVYQPSPCHTMRQYNVFPVGFLLFWVGLFIVGFAVVSYKSQNDPYDMVPFDDVRSDIFGALTHDDVMETSDVIINDEDSVELTTRASVDFEGADEPGIMGSMQDDDATYSRDDGLPELTENDTYPHGDLKLNEPDTALIHDVAQYPESAAEFPSETKDDFGTNDDQVIGNIPQQYEQNLHDVVNAENAQELVDIAANAGANYMGNQASSDQQGSVFVSGNAQSEVPQDTAQGAPSDSVNQQKPFIPQGYGAEDLKMDLLSHGEEEFFKPVELDPGHFSLHVTNHMLDHFQVKLPPLLEGYRNPCWLEQMPEDFTYADSYYNTCNIQMATGEIRYKGVFETFQHNVLNKRASFGAHWRIRCFPYFFLLGVGKCGTTDLFTTLKAYVGNLAPSFLKEPHFWEWKRCHHKMHCHGQRRNPTFAEYLDSLDPPSERVRQQKVQLANGTEYHPMIIGDFTPSSLTFYPCWSGLSGNVGRSEPRYSTPHYIHSIRPQTKFIIILRDPVERIFSNYKMKFRLTSHQGDENARMFHQEMLNATTHLTECMKSDTPRACAYSVMRFDFMTHVSNSMYEIFVTDWLSVFPLDQFLFLRMEDYMENRVPHVNAILSFLGEEPLNPAQQQEVSAKDIANKAPDAEGMFLETREMLQDFFRPFNNRLATLLNNPGYTWGY